MVAEETNTASLAKVSATPSLPNRMISVCVALTTTLTTMSAPFAASAGVLAPAPPSATNRAMASAETSQPVTSKPARLSEVAMPKPIEPSPMRATLGSLDPARLSRLDAQGRLASGDAPTKEVPLHTALYQTRRAARAVVHLHSTHSVALSMLPEIDPRAALPPMTAYYLMKCGSTALVPYYRPGDAAVADAIKGLAGKYSSVLLANHGPVVSGETLEAAVFAIEELEETAKLYLLLRGMNPRYLSPGQIADLVNVFGLTLPEHRHD